MSDVTLPTELLEALWMGPDGTGAYGSTYNAIEKIRQIIRPPKVGEEISRERVNSLPVKSIVRDTEDDLWVRVGDGVALVDLSDGDSVHSTSKVQMVPNVFSPLTLVYIHKESK